MMSVRALMSAVSKVRHVHVPSVSTLRHVSTSRQMMASFTVQDEEEFNEKVMKNEKPTVVDFSAKWCGPCKLLTPRLDAAIAAAEDEVDLAIVDIDDLGDIAMDHGVQAVPTVIGVKNGQVVDRFIGLVDEDKLSSFINKLRE